MEKERNKRKQIKMNNHHRLDRITALPHAIIHHILTFMELIPAIQTSILSRRWRYLWTWIPKLEFDLDRASNVVNDDFDTITPLDRRKRKRFVNFVDRVLMFRESSSIHEFSLTSYLALDRDHLLTWILLILRRHVEVLYLMLNSAVKPFDFPPDVFISNITMLTVSVTLGGAGIRLPSAICSAARIKCMTLEYVILPDGNADGNLVLSCPVLVKLSMLSCEDGHLQQFTVSAPQLQRLDFSNEYYYGNTCKIYLCSPNLKSVTFFFLMYARVSLVNLPALVHANIHIFKPEEMEKNMYDKCLTNVLQGISHVHDLILPSSNVKDIEDSLSILEMTPNLFHNLETIEIRLAEVEEYEIKFLKLILERAVVLKKIIVTACSGKMSTLFSEMLLALPRASSDVVMHFNNSNGA